MTLSRLMPHPSPEDLLPPATTMIKNLFALAWRPTARTLWAALGLLPAGLPLALLAERTTAHTAPPVAPATVQSEAHDPLHAPRLVAESATLELVALPDGPHWRVYIDARDTNAPLRPQSLSMVVQGQRLTARAAEADTWHVTLPTGLRNGSQPVVAELRWPDGRTEQLRGTLDRHAPHADEDEDDHAHGPASARAGWITWVLGGMAAGIGLAAAGFYVLARRRSVTGAPSALPMLAVSLALGTLVSAAPPAQAGPGHDHGDAPATALPDAPRRLPDGALFAPKPAQRQWQLRTEPARTGAWPDTLALDGRVVMDPNAGGRVQAALAGRLMPGPGGLPAVGQRVRQGQVLAYVSPTLTPADQAAQQAQRAELQAAHTLAQQRLTRLQRLPDTVARKDLEAAEAEVRGLGQRLAAISGGITQREALHAPIDGVLASAQGVAGQVVQPGELLYEVIDPRRLMVEVWLHDPAWATRIGAASLRLPGQADEPALPMKLVGTSRSLREQALPVLFAAQGEALGTLALGQLVQVHVHSSQTAAGIALPLAAVVKGPSNEDLVWVKTAPERFAPRRVVHAPLDGVRVRVTAGLADGERVVTQGASLLNQIR